jgi:peroxiredoxin
MNAKRLIFLLAISAALGGLAACSGGAPTAPEPLALFAFSGTVTSGGVGLAWVPVDLGGDAIMSTRTDSRGVFVFVGVSGKSFTITPRSEDYTFTPTSYELGPYSRDDIDFTAAVEDHVLDVGDVAPNFTAVDQNGQTVSLYSYRGMVVLINISADWCGSCRVEAPQLEALYRSYKDPGLQVLTLLVDGSAKDWASEYKLTFPVIQDKNGGLAGPYGLAWLPVNVIIDRTMIIRYKQLDYDETSVVAVIKQYL